MYQKMVAMVIRQVNYISYIAHLYENQLWIKYFGVQKANTDILNGTYNLAALETT